VKCPKCRREKPLKSMVCECGYIFIENHNLNKNSKLTIILPRLLIILVIVTVIFSQLIIITNGHIIVIGILILFLISTIFLFIIYLITIIKNKKK
jgi:hypothetical protein